MYLTSVFVSLCLCFRIRFSYTLKPIFFQYQHPLVLRQNDACDMIGTFKNQCIKI